MRGLVLPLLLVIALALLGVASGDYVVGLGFEGGSPAVVHTVDVKSGDTTRESNLAAETVFASALDSTRGIYYVFTEKPDAQYFTAVKLPKLEVHSVKLPHDLDVMSAAFDVKSGLIYVFADGDYDKDHSVGQYVLTFNPNNNAFSMVHAFPPLMDASDGQLTLDIFNRKLYLLVREGTGGLTYYTFDLANGNKIVNTKKLADGKAIYVGLSPKVPNQVIVLIDTEPHPLKVYTMDMASGVLTHKGNFPDGYDYVESQSRSLDATRGIVYAVMHDPSAYKLVGFSLETGKVVSDVRVDFNALHSFQYVAQ